MMTTQKPSLNYVEYLRCLAFNASSEDLSKTLNDAADYTELLEMIVFGDTK